MTAFVVPMTDRSRPIELVEPFFDGQRPRWYQVETALEVVDYLRRGYIRPMVKLPTGAGKTKTSKIIAMSQGLREVLNVTDRPLRILFFSHKKRLNRQAKKEFAQHETIHLMLQSVFSPIPQKILDEGWDLAMLDECHHEAMFSIQMMLQDISSAPMIGFTADDKRGDGLLLKFDCTVNLLSERMAAEAGYIEMVGVNTILDYGMVNKSDLTKKLLAKYHRHMGATIIFMATNDECEEVGRFITEVLNIPCRVLGKGCGEKKVDEALSDLSAGLCKFVLNCNIIGEGTDSPYVTDVVLAREFRSPQQKKQFIGRAIRSDSPCAAWECINPLRECVTAKSVVGKTKYERILSLRNGEWIEKLISGEDLTWGQMEEIRAEITDSPTLPFGYDDEAANDAVNVVSFQEETQESQVNFDNARLIATLENDVSRQPRKILTLKRKAA
jgi:superfamily II DNA or RNA helicase